MTSFQNRNPVEVSGSLWKQQSPYVAFTGLGNSCWSVLLSCNFDSFSLSVFQFRLVHFNTKTLLQWSNENNWPGECRMPMSSLGLSGTSPRPSRGVTEKQVESRQTWLNVSKNLLDSQMNRLFAQDLVNMMNFMLLTS